MVGWLAPANCVVGLWRPADSCRRVVTRRTWLGLAASP